MIFIDLFITHFSRLCPPRLIFPGSHSVGLVMVSNNVGLFYSSLALFLFLDMAYDMIILISVNMLNAGFPVSDNHFCTLENWATVSNCILARDTFLP